MPTQRTRRTNSTRPARPTGSPADLPDLPDLAASAGPVDEDGEQVRPVPPSTSAGARPTDPRWARCRTCRHLFIAASLVGGDCPGCAGLVPLPLAGEDGRFLPGLSHGSPSPSRPIASSTWRDDVR